MSLQSGVKLETFRASRIAMLIAASMFSFEYVQADIIISVRDARDDAPIDEFRVIAGAPAGTASEEYVKRTGREAANWQPHTIRVGKDGQLTWFKPYYEAMTLRVEADGYQPQLSEWIFKDDDPERVEFLLVEDRGIDGIVLQPDGTPAAGATVARALPQKNIRLENGRIRGAGESPPEKERDRWERPTMAKTDANGAFHFPTETDPASVVVVVHESGVAEMDNADFQKQPEIRLKPWGRVEGQVLWKDKPGIDEVITLGVHRNEYGYPEMITGSVEAQTDAEGRFAFDHVLPGRYVQVSRFIHVPEAERSGTFSVGFGPLIQTIDVRGDGVTTVLLGGQGRTVVGRLTGRTSWDGVTMNLHPDIVFSLWQDPDAGEQRAMKRFHESGPGRLYSHKKIEPKGDGTFEIPHVLPGRYHLSVSAADLDNYAAHRQITVEPETVGAAPQPLDLGEIAVKAKAR